LAIGGEQPPTPITVFWLASVSMLSWSLATVMSGYHARSAGAG
jgi:hypothetical protein